jgi:hypothetical protein
MLHDTALVLHIAGGSLAIVAGYAGLTARKGGRTHQRAGLAFVVAMLVLVACAVPMAVTAAQPINILASGFAAYLVLSGWQAVRRPAGQVGRLELAACLFAAGLATGGVVVGLSQSGVPGGMPVVGFVFGAVAALGAALDVRVLRRAASPGSSGSGATCGACARGCSSPPARSSSARWTRSLRPSAVRTCGSSPWLRSRPWPSGWPGPGDGEGPRPLLRPPSGRTPAKTTA